MALQSIIDRRLAGKNKSVGNRERFLRRYKGQIREAVKRAIDGRGIRDIERGEDITIPRKDISEPVFHHGQGGVRDMVHPGNKEYIKGDRIERPKQGGGGGSGKGQASDSGEGEDDFTFTLTKEEFMQVFFEDLALPHLVRTQLAETPEWKSHRAGFTSDGTPNNLHVVRSMRGASCGTWKPSWRRCFATRRWATGHPACASACSRSASPSCVRASSASPTWTRSTCASATGCACRCRPARR
jgi:uncharacterized protein